MHNTPWYHQRNYGEKIVQEIREFFKIYYHELRYLASVKYETLPDWVKGTRTIYVKICTDGIVISHRQHNTLPLYKPAWPDEDGDLFRVNIFFAHTISRQLEPEFPARSDGHRFLLNDGGPWDATGRIPREYTQLTPIANDTKFGTRQSLHTLWTRLEWVTAGYAVAGRWRDPKLASEEARMTMHYASN